jgi:membrane protein DedA with SNARE-associated domain
VVPGITVLITAGFLVRGGELHAAPAVLWAVAGTLVGDNVNFLIGRYGVRAWAPLRRLIDRHDDVRQFVLRSPPWRYCFFHFPVYLRTFFPLVLGSMHYPARRWIWIDVVGAWLFCTTFLAVGFTLGQLSDGLAGALRWGSRVIVFFSLVLGGWVVVSGILLVRRRRMARRAGKA